ncbi:DUF2889 domain-containing protein [Alphaproteobacteria bacterium]|nr:DUF2889 domain-containing protein [Alphaproteobacteria bacterium]
MSKLPSPANRELIHTRAIKLNCYKRKDQLFDIEANIHDSKPFDTFSNDDNSRLAGEPIHDMWIRITIDKMFIIHNVEASMPTGAHHSCKPAIVAYDKLIGLKIGPGWLKKAKERINSVESCTHLTELLQQIGTTAFQGMFGLSLRSDIMGAKRKPFASNLVNTCYGLKEGGFLDNKRKAMLSD